MAKRDCMIRSIAMFLAALLLFSFVFAVPGAAEEEIASAEMSEIERLEAEKEEIRNLKIEAANKAAQLREEKAEWVKQKAAYDERNRYAQEEILNTQAQIEVYKELIIENQAAAEKAQAAADEIFETYKKRLRSMEENGALNAYVEIIMQAANFGDMLNRVEMMKEIMEYDKRIEQSYRQAHDSAMNLKAEYEQLTLELEQKQTELEEEVKQLEIEIAEADKMIAEIEKEIDEYMAIYNAALLRESVVQKSINTIIAQLKAAELAAEAAAREEAARESSVEEASVNETEPAEIEMQEPLGDTFAAPDTSTVNNSYIWPVPSGKIVTSAFGHRVHPVSETTKYHKGIDISAKAGKPILAADGGTVILTDNDPAGYGIYVVLYHSEGRSTLYAHMSSSVVEIGEVVEQGQEIGYVGSSGMSTGPHLHFEVAVDGELEDPLSYFTDKEDLVIREEE